ncbi:MAG TPA: DUF3105 domain-containing protein [Acidimicrobiales bacterium]|nr:DUF3105 domain-containing protein [Acidimicrobiales bacterium]
MGGASNSKKEPGVSPSVRALRVVMTAVGVLVLAVSACNSSGGDAAAPPDGTEQFDVGTANHVPGDVEYSQTPPVGGDHDPAWQNCGVYREPVREENAVHSLEHGAVWITYGPDLEDEAIQALEERARGETHVLVTPFEELGDRVVLSAWGRQLRVDSADDERIDAFISAFQQGPQSPEAGASCSGAIGDPR